MLKKNLSKSALVVALLTTTVIWRGTTAYAEDPNQAFTLDPMIVTAQRTETRDLDTPATTNIITEQNIKEAGYKNVFDAIEHQVGLTSTGYGDAGQDFGFSSGRTVIRGYDRGTLVMVDGIPMNLKNYNSLDGIPIDMVQQIEISKGAAGTLYGSEAMGGVVNVITKRPGGKTQVKVKGTVGNYYKDYGVTYAGEKLIVTASKEYSNKLTHSNAYPEGSSTDWWVGKGQKNRAGISAALTDEIGFTFIYQDGNITRGSNNDAKKVGSVYKKYNYRYDDKRITTGLTYNGKYNGIKALVGYNYRRTEGYDFAAATPGPVSSSADLSSYIGDVQKTWNLGKNTLITGYSLRRENYENLVTKANKAHRTSNAIYLSYNNVFSDKFSATLGLRGEIIDDPVKSENILNPQFQTLYKINDTTSWYINIGKAFQMPTVDSYYGKKAAAVASASKKVRMIFFNACFSQKEAQAVVDKVEAAIGMNTEIGDEAAIVFAAQFYSSIGFGQNLQQAFDQAKAALLLKGIAEENTPVLYVRKGLLAQDIVMVESEALKKSDNVTIMQKIKKFFRDQRILR